MLLEFFSFQFSPKKELPWCRVRGMTFIISLETLSLSFFFGLVFSFFAAVKFKMYIQSIINFILVTILVILLVIWFPLNLLRIGIGNTGLVNRLVNRSVNRLVNLDLTCYRSWDVGILGNGDGYAIKNKKRISENLRNSGGQKFIYPMWVSIPRPHD